MAPAAATAAAPAPRPAPSPPSSPRRSFRGLLAGAAALLVVAGVVVGAVALTGGGDPSPSRSAAGDASAVGTAGASSTPPTDTPAAADDTADDTSETPAPTSEDADAVTRSPTEAVSAYYALLPGRLDQGWERLTSSYQQRTAGGYDGYQDFWGPMDRVTVRGVSPAGGDSVDATVTYSYADGRVIDERTVFDLVRDDGRWKIDGSRVLSSRAG